MIRIARPWMLAGLVAVIVVSVASLPAAKDEIVFADQFCLQPRVDCRGGSVVPDADARLFA